MAFDLVVIVVVIIAVVGAIVAVFIKDYLIIDCGRSATDLYFYHWFLLAQLCLLIVSISTYVREKKC